MAERQSSIVGPIQDRVDDTSCPQTAAMSEQQFANALRAVCLGRDTAAVMAVGSEQCKRLGASPKAVSVGVLPPGSSQFDAQSIFAWMRRIQPGDVEAIQQLRTLTGAAFAFGTK